MSKPSTGLTGLTVQFRSLRVSCASRTAASEVKSRTAPPGSEVGRRVWAGSETHAITNTHAQNSAFLSRPNVEVSVDPIAIAKAPDMPLSPTANAGLFGYYEPNFFRCNIHLVGAAEKVLPVEGCNTHVAGGTNPADRMEGMFGMDRTKDQGEEIPAAAGLPPEVIVSPD